MKDILDEDNDPVLIDSVYGEEGDEITDSTNTIKTVKNHMFFFNLVILVVSILRKRLHNPLILLPSLDLEVHFHSSYRLKLGSVLNFYCSYLGNKIGKDLLLFQNKTKLHF